MRKTKADANKQSNNQGLQDEPDDVSGGDALDLLAKYCIIQ